FTVYSYLLLLIATGMLIQGARHSAPAYRRQQILVLLATFLPWLANLIEVFRLIPSLGIDPTPLAFMFSGAAIYLSVNHYGLLEIAPIARRVVVDNLPDGILVLSPDERILDINPTLAGWLGLSAERTIGRM